MKKFLLLLLLGVTIGAKAQTAFNSYDELIKKNFSLLIKDSSLLDFVSYSSNGILTMLDETKHPEFRLYKDEVAWYNNTMKDRSNSAFRGTYTNKGTDILDESHRYDYYQYQPATEFMGLFIALDPGHYADSWADAKREMRYVKMRGSDLGLDHDVKFYEADLAYKTALLLKDTLESLGALVELTRPEGKTSLGKTFNEWYEKDFRNDLIKAYRNQDITQEQYNTYKTSSRAEIQRTFFSYMEFTTRAHRMNDLGPDLAFSIHYNIKDDNVRDAKDYIKPVQDNYTMAFIPGAFVKGELKKKDWRMNFVRLLVTHDLQESLRAARFYNQVAAEDLGVPAFPEEKAHYHLDNFSLPTDYEGVFARNLYLTRSVEAPMVYIEALYQDNIEEAKKLAMQDYEKNGIVTSKRVKEVSDAIVKSISLWLEENAKLAIKKGEYVLINTISCTAWPAKANL